MSSLLKNTGLLLSTCIVIGIHTITAQDVEFKSSNFKDNKDGFKLAEEALKKGEEYLEKGNEAASLVNDIKDYFERAVYYFEKANAFNPNNSLLNYYLGNALIYTNRKYEARAYMDKSLKLNPSPDPMFYYHYALVQQMSLEYDAALKSIDRFYEEAKSKRAEELKKLLVKFRKECKDAPAIVASPVRAWVDNMEINSAQDDFSPSLTADGELLIFTSKRNNSHQPNDIGLYDGDIYLCELTKGKWGKVENVGLPLSTDADESVSALSYDGQRMLLFSYRDSNANVMESRLDGLKWQEPKLKMSDAVNSEANESYASYEPMDIKVFYVFDGKLKGDKDIFFSGIMDRSRDTWGKGQSVGSTINTGFNEGTVYIHPDGRTMYFSSQGHNSIGGYDIFKAELINGTWTNPVNMGYPINTPYDDLFFVSTANNKFGYIASNRAGGKGGLDLYQVTFWGEPKQVIFDSEDHLLASQTRPTKSVPVEAAEKVEKKSLTVFKGKVIDYITKKPVGAQIEITDNSTAQVIQSLSSNSATGKFLLSLPSGKNYGISVNKEGFLFHSENFDLPELSEFNMVNKDVELKNIAVGSKIALRNVFYEVGKSDVKSDSYSELNRLADLLQKVPRLKIELSGHTDNTGSEELNKKLSQERAEAVKAYLVSRGISADRLQAKGYGSSRPVESNDTSTGRTMNRRTEYEIIAN